MRGPLHKNSRLQVSPPPVDPDRVAKHRAEHRVGGGCSARVEVLRPCGFPEYATPLRARPAGGNAAGNSEIPYELLGLAEHGFSAKQNIATLLAHVEVLRARLMQNASGVAHEVTVACSVQLSGARLPRGKTNCRAD
jgi:hypothetical protein